MHPELTILKLFLESSNWDKYGNILQTSDFPEELQPFHRAIESFHNLAEEKQNLSIGNLGGLLYSYNPKKQEFTNEILDTLNNLVINEEFTIELINKVKRGQIYRKLSLLAYDIAEGRKDADEFSTLVNQLHDAEVPVHTVDFVEEDLETLIEQTYNQPGLRWRLQCLNKSLGSLRKGDFGFIFARPETGKTTFLASEISHMAEQLNEDSGPIIWFNNEEEGKKVKTRVYQGSLGLTLSELSANIPNNQTKYLEKTKNKIKIVDDAQLSKYKVESVCHKYKPSLIVFDQIDKIHGFKADREDLLLGSIYQWARELGKSYCPVVAVCQSDGTGENVRYLTMSNVVNAKTSKQAEADWILGIGCIHDTGWEQIRFLNISKNKLQGDVDTDSKLRHGKFETLIQPDIARYKDI